MSAHYLIELDDQNFQSSLELSLHTPLLVYFWGSTMPESLVLKQQIEDLANEYNGAFIVASLNCETHQMLAAQFGVQALPTMVLFNQGRPVAALDPMQAEQNITVDMVRDVLTQHIALPDQNQLAFAAAIDHMQQSNFNQALIELKQLEQVFAATGEYKLAIAECYIETKQFELAESILNTVLMQDQDSKYKSLLAKVELHNQAANNDEIRHLQQAYAENPANFKLGFDLAIQLNQINQQEQALEILLAILQQELNFAEGDAKKAMMDILAALGQGNELASRYRRKLYALLY